MVWGAGLKILLILTGVMAEPAPTAAMPIGSLLKLDWVFLCAVNFKHKLGFFVLFVGGDYALN